MSLSVLRYILFLLSIVVAKSLAIITSKNIITAANTTKPGCQRTCGNLTIPYPFGIGHECYLEPHFGIKCDTSYNPPRAFHLLHSDWDILGITETQVMVRNKIIATKCYDSQGNVRQIQNGSFQTWGSTFTISHTSNKLTVLGCDDYALVDYSREVSPGETSPWPGAGCIALCHEPVEVVPRSCVGTGCCQVDIPIGLRMGVINLHSLNNRRNTDNKFADVQPCSYGFFAGSDTIKFGGKIDLTTIDILANKTMQQVPLVLDWAAERSISCIKAKNHSTYLCQSNTECINSDAGGYNCRCLRGYEGNPYLEPGCTDVDECAAAPTSPCSMVCNNTLGSYECSCPPGYTGDGFKSGTGCKDVDECAFGANSPCSMLCTNRPGSYTCSCPRGYFGDGLKSGTGCTRKQSQTTQTTIILGLSISLGTIFLTLGCWWLYTIIQKRKIMQKKAINFQQNGGLLLQQQMSSDENAMERMKIFTADELEKATDNFCEDRALGKGGQGTVYKGMLSDGKLVAIKKSKQTDDERHSKQFINELIILTRINHRNIVKLLGSCLETEVPLIVYEFIPNGNLFHQIHNASCEFPLTWKMRLQIAYDSASALNYLHTSSSIPVFHRDTKSSNILLDDKYRAKLSDFGISKSVDIDQTHVTTGIMGTPGYLDPEYFQSKQFTEKSDVYSFGVVLVELLTGQKVIYTILGEAKSLIWWFLSRIENSCLLEVIDAQILHQSSYEEFLAIANIAVRCLKMDGQSRPTMREVQRDIEVIINESN